MERKDFYDDATYQALLDRLGRLTADAKPEWGVMTPAQMCAHCAEIAEVAEGSRPLEGTPWVVRLIRGWIRKMVVSDKPYPKSSKTHPQYVISSPVDFEEQRARLLAVLERQKSAGPEGGPPHPLFGEMTPDEKGWVAYKHMDHHLRQFGV